MKIDVQAIAGILKQEISQYEARLDMVQVGRVLQVGDGIARIHGLKDALAGEMLLFENETIGEVLNLEEDSLGAVIYGDYTKIREGSDVRSAGRLMSVAVGEEVVTILAGSSGLLDDIPVAAVAGLVTDMLRWLHSRHPDLIAEINKTGKLGEGPVLELTDRINEYKAIFKETRLRQSLDATAIPAPQGDRPYRPEDVDSGELSEDGHLDVAFDDSRRDGIAGEPCGVV